MTDGLTLAVVLLGTWDMMMAMNGLLAGMVATCSCCNVIQPWAALIVGFTGSIVYYAQSWITEHIFHMDDPLDAAALHMGAGFWYVAERKRSTGPDAEGRCVVLDRSLTNVLLNTAGE
jgi:ammonia channel protein AmtB